MVFNHLISIFVASFSAQDVPPKWVSDLRTHAVLHPDGHLSLPSSSQPVDVGPVAAVRNLDGQWPGRSKSCSPQDVHPGSGSLMILMRVFTRRGGMDNF